MGFSPDRLRQTRHAIPVGLPGSLAMFPRLSCSDLFCRDRFRQSCPLSYEDRSGVLLSPDTTAAKTPMIKHTSPAQKSNGSYAFAPATAAIRATALHSPDIAYKHSIGGDAVDPKNLKTLL